MKNVMKKMLVVLLALTLILPSTVFAANSPSKTNIAGLPAKAYSVTYNGSWQTARLRVTTSDGTVLKEGTDYVVTSAKRTYKKAGTYTVTIQGIGKYTGTQDLKYTIKKATQYIKARGVKNTVRASVLAKKSLRYTLKTSAKDKAKVTFKSSTSKIRVTSSGKVVMRKGLKKGTYTITLRTKATNNVKAGKRIIVIRVK